MTRSIGGRWGASRPSDAAIAEATRSASVTGASGTNQAPSGYRSTQSLARASESRVLPVPPGPVSVRSRVRSSSVAALSTSARPTKVVSCGGRLLGVRSSVRKAGNVVSRPAASTWYSRSGRAKSLSRCSPRSRSAMPAPGSPATDRVASVTITWPPCAGRADARRPVDLDARRSRPRRRRPRPCGSPSGRGRRRPPTRAFASATLGGHGGADRPGRRRERREHGVALEAHGDTTLGVDGGLDERAVRAEHRAVGRVADLGEQAGRALDVGEQERDDALGQRTRSRGLLARPARSGRRPPSTWPPPRPRSARARRAASGVADVGPRRHLERDLGRRPRGPCRTTPGYGARAPTAGRHAGRSPSATATAARSSSPSVTPATSPASANRRRPSASVPARVVELAELEQRQSRAGAATRPPASGRPPCGTARATRVERRAPRRRCRSRSSAGCRFPSTTLASPGSSPSER